MIFNSALTVPDAESATQLKNRVKAKPANPYNAGFMKAKIRKEAAETEKTEPAWAAASQEFDQSVAEGSAVASIAARAPSKVPFMPLPVTILLPVHMLWLISSGFGPNLRLRPKD